MDLLAPGPVLLLVVVAVVLVAGGAWRGLERLRRRRAFAVPAAVAAEAPPLVADGEPVPPGLEDAVPAAGGPSDGVRARVVVVGTRSCSDCARTLALLRRETADDPAVAVHHVLAEQAPGLVDRFHVRTAPTVLLVDADARVVGVHPGAVDVDVARAALRDLAVGRRPFAAGGAR